MRANFIIDVFAFELFSESSLSPSLSFIEELWRPRDALFLSLSLSEAGL